VDLEIGELVHGGVDLSQAAYDGAEGGIGKDDADLAGQGPQPAFSRGAPMISWNPSSCKARNARPV